MGILWEKPISHAGVWSPELWEFCERNRQPHGSLVTRVHGNSVRKNPSATWELGHRSLWEFCERNPSATWEFCHQSLWEFCKRNPSATQELGHQSLWEFCERNRQPRRSLATVGRGLGVVLPQQHTSSPQGQVWTSQWHLKLNLLFTPLFINKGGELFNS